jgi:hypothetical protein
MRCAFVIAVVFTSNADQDFTMRYKFVHLILQEMLNPRGTYMRLLQ